MKVANKFKFCPNCGNKIQPALKNFSCSSCGFNYYFNPAPTVAAIILNENKALLLTQRKHEPFSDYWDLPGGFIEMNESIEEGITRECLEELGVEIKVEKYFWSDPQTYEYKGTEYNLIDSSFLCTYTGELRVGDDVKACKFFSQEKLPLKITPAHRRLVNEIVKAGLIS